MSFSHGMLSTWCFYVSSAHCRSIFLRGGLLRRSIGLPRLVHCNVFREGHVPSPMQISILSGKV